MGGSSWAFGATILLSVLLPACTDQPVEPLAEPVAIPIPGETIWAQRLDPDYFNYTEFAHTELYLPADAQDPPPTERVDVPVGLEYLSALITFYTKDPYVPPPVMRERPRIEATWDDGSPAFDVESRSLCGSRFQPGTYCATASIQTMAQAPPNATALELTAHGSGDIYIDVILEIARPFSYNGNQTPPYVRKLDPDYFESTNGTKVDVDIPQTPAETAQETVVDVSGNASFLKVSVAFQYGHHFTSEPTSLVVGSDAEPAVVGWWDGQSGAFDIPLDVSRGPTTPLTPRQGIAEPVVLLVPEGAKSITISSKGWGGDIHARVEIGLAVPMDPYDSFEPKGESEQG